MKRKHVKIPFSLIVKEAGLARAARWMPLGFNLFMLFGLLTAVQPEHLDVPAFLSYIDPNALLLSFSSVVFGLAVLEFIGAFIDFFLAWLSLRKARN